MTDKENWKIHVQFAQKETNCCPFNSRGNFKVCIMSNASYQSISSDQAFLEEEKGGGRSGVTYMYWANNIDRGFSDFTVGERLKSKLVFPVLLKVLLSSLLANCLYSPKNCRDLGAYLSVVLTINVLLIPVEFHYFCLKSLSALLWRYFVIC